MKLQTAADEEFDMHRGITVQTASHRRVTLASFSALAVVLLALGLSTIRSPQIQPGAAARANSAQAASVYQDAKQRFGKGDYAGALAKLDALVLSPDLTPNQQAFYERQRQICRDALGGKKPGAADAAPQARFVPSVDCGPRALLLVCKDRGIAAPSLARVCKAAGTGKEGTTLRGLAKAAQTVGLQASGVQMDRVALGSLDQPAIAWVDGSHYIAVLEVHTSLTGATSATVHDPSEPYPKPMSVEELLQRSGGVLLVLRKPSSVVAVRG